MYKTCLVCGAQFWIKRSHARLRKTCGKVCGRVRAKEIFKGDGNPAHGKTYRTKETHPEWAAKIKQSSVGRVNLGPLNGMKNPAARDAVSTSQRLRFQNPSAREEMSRTTAAAWRRGDFEGVRVGQCDWFAYQHEGKAYKVQGAWELAFIHWMCQNGLRFSCHRGRVSYKDGNGVSRSWYPDFFVYDWDGWVDVKCDHFYRPEKFDAVRLANPGIRFWVLLQKDLSDLGVLIYGPGHKYLPYLQTLVDTGRIGRSKDEDLASLVEQIHDEKMPGPYVALAALERNKYDRQRGGR